MITKALAAAAAFGSKDAADNIREILRTLELPQEPPKLSEKQVTFLGKQTEQEGQPN